MQSVVDQLREEVNLHDMTASEEELNNRLLLEAARIGKFTPSEFYRLMTYEDDVNKWPGGAETYAMEKAAEHLTNSCDFNTGWQSEDMARGNEMEPKAVERFVKETGISVDWFGENQSFIEYRGDNKILLQNVGGTPDGSIDQEVGLEIKCPKSKTHLSYIMNLNAETFKKEVTNYYWQVQGYMMLTGKAAWFFVSYDDRFVDPSKQVLILRIDRNETDIQKLLARLEKAVLRKNEILKQIKEKECN